jgi:hypothetical protein
LWLIAVWRGRDRNCGRAWILVAALVQFAVFLFPHTVIGSELDYMETAGSQ